METVKVILNPYAGRGRGAKVAGEIETAFRRHNVPCEIAATSAPEEAVSLARRARQDGYAIVAAAGGDGTVHEVMNGLAEATPADETVQGLAVLQAGSGNDFADMVGTAREIDAAVHAIREGNTRNVDLGLVEAFDGRNTLRRHFDNNLGIGFEAQVTAESRKIKRLRGFLIYLWATLRALRAYDQPHFEISWTDGAGNERRAAKEMLLISIGNSRRVGGAFYLTPDALMDDGLLDLAIADALSQLGILNLLPKAMTRTGLHGQKAVSFDRLRSATIAVRQPVPVHTDGDILSTRVERLTVEIQPGRLQVIV